MNKQKLRIIINSFKVFAGSWRIREIVDLLDHMKILIGNWISQSAFPHDGPMLGHSSIHSV